MPARSIWTARASSDTFSGLTKCVTMVRGIVAKGGDRHTDIKRPRARVLGRSYRRALRRGGVETVEDRLCCDLDPVGGCRDAVDRVVSATGPRRHVAKAISGTVE